jgi:hypothetical protein
MVDTGSTGVRVLRVAVPEQTYSASKQTSIYGFTSGARLIGVIASAVVTIGQASTDEAIPIQIVKSVDCSASVPRCPASRVSAADYRIGGDGLARQGFGAIVGVNLGSADAVNPLAHIGAHSWIVTLPRPNEDRPGTLIVNPDSGDRAGYAPFPTDYILRRLSGAGGFQDAIAGCLVSANLPKRICGPTLLDTGAPGFHISSANASDLSGWNAGLSLEIVFKSENGAELSAKFVADSGRSSRLSTGVVPEQPRTRISAGSLPYFTFSVLYDAEQSVIGLKRR